MTQIEFHSKVSDKLQHACRLLSKAYLAGARVVVTGDPAALKQLDALLWSFSPTQFVPHCGADVSSSVLAASPVRLAASIDHVSEPEVLVNLGEGVPLGFERFKRLIEVVCADDGDAQAARARWRYYTGLGHPLKNHDISSRPT